MNKQRLLTEGLIENLLDTLYDSTDLLYNTYSPKLKDSSFKLYSVWKKLGGNGLSKKNWKEYQDYCCSLLPLLEEIEEGVKSSNMKSKKASLILLEIKRVRKATENGCEGSD